METHERLTGAGPRTTSRGAPVVAAQVAWERMSVRVTVVGLAGVAGACVLVRALDSSGFASRFALGALTTWGAVAWLLWRTSSISSGSTSPRPWRSGKVTAGSATNPRQGMLGLATTITLTRGFLVSLLGGFVLLPDPKRGLWSWVPGFLYTAAAIADRCDGKIARRRGEVTALGARLDVAMDALGLLIAPLVAVRWGRLPAWYLLLGGAYYLFAAGKWVRMRLGLPVYPDRLRPTGAARFFAGVQMTVCAVALYPVLPPVVTAIAATAAMLPTLALFGREWLILTGRSGQAESPSR